MAHERTHDRRGRRRGGALVVALGLMVLPVTGACTSDDDGEDADGGRGDRGSDPGGVTEAELADVDDCEELHTVVLAWLDDASARARRVQGEGAALDAMVDSLMNEDGPLPGLEPLEGLFPAAPYGGIAGPVAADRYDTLECAPGDELPAILDWFGLPEGTPLTVDEGPLGSAIDDRVAELGVGGFVAIGLGRRLVEGASLPDSPLMMALADVARAQEAHRAATGTYATDLALLAPYLDDPTLVDPDGDGPVIIVTAADADRYCVHGADGASAVVESHDGVPRDRVPGTPSCPNTFPDIDDDEGDGG